MSRIQRRQAGIHSEAKVFESKNDPSYHRESQKHRKTSLRPGQRNLASPRSCVSGTFTYKLEYRTMFSNGPKTRWQPFCFVFQWSGPIGQLNKMGAVVLSTISKQNRPQLFWPFEYRMSPISYSLQIRRSGVLTRHSLSRRILKFSVLSQVDSD